MSRTLTSARVILALAFAGFGLQYLRILPTIGPPWHRAGGVFAVALGILLLAAAVGLLLRATAHFAAWVMACYFSIRFLRAYVLHLPLLLANRHDPIMWNAFGGLLALTVGMWMLSSLLPATLSATPAALTLTLAAGRYIFAVPLVIRVALALHNGNEWTSMFIALTMVGSALVVAAASPRKA
jgi:hypothetical protein